LSPGAQHRGCEKEDGHGAGTKQKVGDDIRMGVALVAPDPGLGHLWMFAGHRRFR
jgi:hypothetical protein